MSKNKLWIFGDSFCTAMYLPSDDLGWPIILANKLGLECSNFAKVACDNFYIYASYLANKSFIADQDLVIIGWSHPSRKSFVLDRNNPEHNVVIDQSFLYKLYQQEFIRSNNHPQVNDDYSKLLHLTPRDSGIQFYDNWFKNYYSKFEQNCNFQSYFDSVKATCPAKYVPFFFSKKSTNQVDVSGAGYMLEFVLENNVAISEENLHLTEQGHKMWAEYLFNVIDSAA